MRQLVLALAAVAILIVSSRSPASAGERTRAAQPSAAQPSAAAAACPRYASLMRAASRALERGDRATALGHLREARAALESCSRTAPRGDALARGAEIHRAHA